jgi:YVTN family beta-propeller protein
VDRSPTDLALLPGTTRLLTTNQTADTVSLVDFASGNVLSEVPVGHRPFAVAVTPDGKQAVVTNTWSNSVTLLKIGPATLTVKKTISIGIEPRGVAISPNGHTAYIALAGEEAAVAMDLSRQTVTRRFPSGSEPWHLALTPDGNSLVVGNSRGRTTTIFDPQTGQERYTVKVLGRNLRHIAISADGKWAYFPTISERGQGVTRENIDRGWVVGNRLVRVPLTAPGSREAITLDIQSNAVGDVDGTALSPDGKQIALTAGGTHELLLLRVGDLPFITYGGPGDHLDSALQDDTNRFRRIKLGGRPLGAQYTPDGKSILIANYLLNAIQVVDPLSGEITRTIALGGPTTPSLARRGEALFQDANRSFGSWYSCNSCHVEGFENGALVDTYNDGSLGTLKRTLSLRGVTETAPWTWHGWRKDLRQLIHDSFTVTMQGPEPSSDDLDAMMAYLKSLDLPQNPNRLPDGSLTAAAKRGEVVFTAKGCASCHTPPLYTSSDVYDVGMEEPHDPYKGFNPPSLRGVYRRTPYLHDGRAKTLEDVLTQWHRPTKLTGKPDCTPAELADLVAFLTSL